MNEYERFLELTGRRRSIRRFTPEPLPEGIIEKVVEAVRHAPSGFNCQLWEFVIIDDPATKARICDIIGTQMDAEPIRPAPVFIIALGDIRVREYGPPGMKGHEEKWKNVFYSSMAIATAYLSLGAASLGLGARWFSCYPGIASQIKEYLHLPEYLEFYEMLVLGRADGVAAGKTLRNVAEMVHHNICEPGEFRSDGELARHFGKKSNP